MKHFISMPALTLMLGACASAPTPSTPISVTPGSAAFSTTTLEYTVTQGGATHVLSYTAANTPVEGNTMSYWASTGSGISGFATGNTLAGNTSLAAGLDNGTYFAGISGTLTGVVLTSGVATYAGRYGFVVNGVDQHGPLALMANFATGIIADTTPGITVNGTISGANIGGDVTINGETGTIKGGFYGFTGGYLAAVAVGPNMAGVMTAQ